MKDRNEQEARTRRPWLAGGGLVLAMIGVLVLPGLVSAQDLPIETYPEPGKPESRSEALRLPDTPTRPPGTGTYPRDVGVHQDPAFIEPLAGRYETAAGGGRFGLSGWTAPNVPVGAAQNGASEVNGWFSLGFSFTWGDPH